ncbi:CPBP family intramembrane glutamic endopeptidase [Halorussus lipolyticus]|uniref:CPBP family intramembrane glutamic endopeptidase n=1 Tax=Halorussus lipolyticus TaxID=3034024 RepID=UPI0023E792A7|nr:CPBP family intramembrane glutamic endopeptidase [Halorussus sp. DT80]
MAELPFVWIAAVAGYLVAQLAYIAAFASAASAYPRLRRYNFWLYAAFSLAYGGAFYATAPVTFAFEFRPAYLALLLVGFAMYYADTYAVSYLAGESLRQSVSHPISMLPVVLVVVPEEILFRAGLSPLIDAVGPAAFVAASAVLFGLIHFTFGARDVLVKTFDGAVFAVVFVATGSLTASVLTHLGYNLASFHVFADYDRDVTTLP